MLLEQLDLKDIRDTIRLRIFSKAIDKIGAVHSFYNMEM
jgi:hypothetical protein